MLIGGCLHGIHIQCYIKVVGENNLHSYICPLCSTPLNCILPLQFDTENSEAYEISCSSITISLNWSGMCRCYWLLPCFRSCREPIGWTWDCLRS